MKLYVAADHLGVEVKKKLIKHLKQGGVEALEIGIPNTELDDYPDFAFKLGKLVQEDERALGILICGNGVGMSIAANKVSGIRCVRATSVDDAYKGKSHNGCNVLAVGANLGSDLINEIVDTFITTEPPSTDRYLKRIDKIINYEAGTYNEL